VILRLLCLISVWRVGNLYTGIGLGYRGSGMVFWVGTVHKQELPGAHNGTVHLHLRYLFALGFCTLVSTCIRGVFVSGLYLVVSMSSFWALFSRVGEVS